MQQPFVAATETTNQVVHPATNVDIYLDILVLYLCANLRLHLESLLVAFGASHACGLLPGYRSCLPD